MQKGRFKLDNREKNFTGSFVRHWKTFYKAEVVLSSLEVFIKHVDIALEDMV